MQDTERNPVTWGVFPGQEIVQSTIIEEESFLTWKVRVPDSLSRFGPEQSNGLSLGRGIFNLEGLGVAVPARLTGTTAIGTNHRYALASQRHTSRFPKTRCIMELLI